MGDLKLIGKYFRECFYTKLGSERQGIMCNAMYFVGHNTLFRGDNTLVGHNTLFRGDNTRNIELN